LFFVENADGNTDRLNMNIGLRPQDGDMNLRATKNDNTGNWIVQGKERAVEFKDLIGAIGFGDIMQPGDYALNAISVVGLRLDEKYQVIGEALGTLDDIARQAVDFKDSLLIEHIYLDATFEVYRKRLMAEDGLTQYEKIGDKPSRQRRKHDVSHWEHYRDDLEEEPVAYLIPLPEHILGDFEGALSKVQSLVTKEELLIAPWCRKSLLLQREGERPGKLPLDHPLLRAMVYAVNMLISRNQPLVTRDEYHRPYQERL